MTIRGHRVGGRAGYPPLMPLAVRSHPSHNPSRRMARAGYPTMTPPCRRSSARREQRRRQCIPRGGPTLRGSRSERAMHSLQGPGPGSRAGLPGPASDAGPRSGPRSRRLLPSAARLTAAGGKEIGGRARLKMRSGPAGRNPPSDSLRGDPELSECRSPTGTGALSPSESFVHAIRRHCGLWRDASQHPSHI